MIRASDVTETPTARRWRLRNERLAKWQQEVDAAKAQQLRCGGCAQDVSKIWTYCPYCGSQARVGGEA